jgi:hypothetical protein
VCYVTNNFNIRIINTSTQNTLNKTHSMISINQSPTYFCTGQQSSEILSDRRNAILYYRTKLVVLQCQVFPQELTPCQNM